MKGDTIAHRDTANDESWVSVELEQSQTSFIHSIFLFITPLSLYHSISFFLCFTFSVECLVLSDGALSTFRSCDPQWYSTPFPSHQHISNIYSPLWHNRQVSQTANSATRLLLNSATNNRRRFTCSVKGSIIVNYLDIIQQWNIPFNGKTPGPNNPGFSVRVL